MKTINGDLIQLALNGDFDVIVHGCNCFCTMGAGIAKSIKQRFRRAYQADLNTVKGDKSKLGSYSLAVIEIDDRKVYIINAYTQYHWKGTGNKVDYDSIRSIFAKIKVQFSGKRIAYPLIGAGLGGGDWQIIKKIIETELKNENHTLVIFNKKS